MNLKNLNMRSLLKECGLFKKDLVYEEEYQGGFYALAYTDFYHIEIGKKTKKDIAILNVFSSEANHLLELVECNLRIGGEINKDNYKFVKSTPDDYYEKNIENYNISVFLKDGVIDCIIIEDLDQLSTNASSTKLNILPEDLISIPEEYIGYYLEYEKGFELILEDYEECHILKLHNNTTESINNFHRRNYKFDLYPTENNDGKIYGYRSRVNICGVFEKSKLKMFFRKDKRLNINGTLYDPIDKERFEELEQYIVEYRERMFR